MEDQGKRLLLTVGIALVIMVAWTYLFPPEPEPKAPSTPAEVAPGTAVAPPPVAPGAVAPGTAVAPVAEAAPRGPEQTVELGAADFRATFSTYGGALKSWQLLGQQFYDRTPSTPEDLVRGGGDEAAWPFQVSFPSGSTHPVPIGVEWELASKSETELVFRRVEGPLTVTKTFRLHPTRFVVEMTVEATLASGTALQTLVISTGGFQDPKDVEDGGMAGTTREWRAACYAEDELSTWSAKNLTGTSKEVGGEVDWFGFVYPYFMAAIAVEPLSERVTCRATGGATAGPMRVEAIFTPAQLVAGTPYRRTVVGYLGPKYRGSLEGVAALVGWEDTNLEKAVDLGWLGFLAGPLLALLNFFYGVFGNWPLAIVLLTVTVKAATFYWTHKSMKSMKAMSRLKPELEALKDKYKDDRQRQQIETMNLFKANGVNPLAGCLPMLLQMPIWFALYKALSVAAELYQARFLWVDDLTAADPYFILPVFMTVTMLVQALLQPATASGAQQKMLTWGMPIIFGGMSLFFPAGLTLYISTNGILTLLHHLYLRAEDRKPPAAKVASVVAGPGDVIDAESEEAPAAPTTPARKRRPPGRGGRRRG